MKLPFVISVPHGGQRIPEEAASCCILTSDQILADSDEGATAIYASLGKNVEAFVTTEVARAIVDLNRAEDDRRPDGVVKTHTCLEVPVYSPFPSEEVVDELLDKYYRPYHRRLTELASSGVVLGIDCHTMLAIGPPIGPMAGEERPKICLGNLDGRSCPNEWVTGLGDIMGKAFGVEVAINHPFKGGHITRAHASEIPWLQIEMSRAPFFPEKEKSRRMLEALRRFHAVTLSRL